MATQYQPDAQAAIQQARLEQAKLDSDAIAKQLFDQLVESVQTQKAMLMVVRQGATAEQNQVTLLDAHVQEIACLIKGCKPQAQR